MLVLAQNDETRAGVDALARDFVARGARVLLAGGEAPGVTALADASTAHPAIEPMLMIQSFYRVATALALARGLDPDRRRICSKVTETL